MGSRLVAADAAKILPHYPVPAYAFTLHPSYLNALRPKYEKDQEPNGVPMVATMGIEAH
jgi:hypothetical protein